MQNDSQSHSTSSPEMQKSDTKKSSLLKKILKIFLYIIVAIVSINILLYVALSIPFVQQKVLAFAVDKVKEITKSEISIDEIRLHLFSSVSLKGVYLEDQSKDTLVYAKDLSVHLNPFELLKNKLQIDGINLSDFTIKVSQKNSESDFNYQFLIDAFAGDTTSTDTTSSSLKIAIEDIKLKNGRLTYDILADSLTDGIFNPSHIHINNLNAEVYLPSLDMSNLKANLASLSFIEQSGLVVSNLTGKITSQQFNIKGTDIQLDLPQSSIKLKEVNYHLITKEFNLISDQSTLSPSDITPFMKDLKSLENKINFRTDISGKLPALKIDSLLINYGEDAMLKGSASISDYSRYDTAAINLNISDFKINANAIEQFAHLGDSTFVAPDILNSLGYIYLNANLSGRLSKFNLKAESWMNHGAVQMLANGSIDTTFTNFDVHTKIQTQNFNLGKLLENPDLGKLSMNIGVDASQSPKKTLSANLNGSVNNIEYNKVNYNNIPFTAYYNAQKMGLSLKANLPEGSVDGEIDMTQAKNPTTSFNLLIQNLKLDKFADFPDWKNPELSLNLSGNILGLDINTLQGSVDINNLKFSHDSVSFYPGKISLEIARNVEDQKNLIRLSSAFFNADLLGKYDFLTLYDEFNGLMNNYLPSLFPKSKKYTRKTKNNNFDFNILVQNTKQIEDVFDLPFNILKPITINGQFHAAENLLSAKGLIPSLKFGTNIIKNTSLILANNDSLIDLNLSSLIRQEDNVFSLTGRSKIAKDSLDTYLNLKSDSINLNIDATLEALTNLKLDKKNNLETYVQFKPTVFNIGNLNLDFMPALIQNDIQKTSISNFGFKVGKGKTANRILGIDGIISNSKQDTLNINFTNTEVADILSAFNINNINTNINGDIKLVNVMNLPEMYTNDFRLNDIIIFGDTLGDMRMYSEWDDAQGGIRFYSTLGRNGVLSKVRGYAYPRQDSLDVDINLNKFSLNWLEPFTVGILNRVSGSISSGIEVTGKISAPDVNGWLGVNDTYLGIDYTNVTYRINDTITVNSDKIGFENLTVTDSYNNKAKVNALITHKNFNNLQYNIDMTLRNFMVLNTESRTDSLFYGKVFANGTVNIKGTQNLMNVNMDVRNSKNSKINVLIPQTSSAIDYASIVYINTPESENEGNNIIKEEPYVFPMKVAGNVGINKDIVLDVIIDPITGDKMQIIGSGLVKFNYDSESEVINTFGSYIISSGFVKLRLQDLYNMQFQIENGSKVDLNGDPLKSTFNITAYKRVRADLKTLDASFDTSGGNTKVLVDCVLGISGDMNKMNLTYNIRLPDAPDDVQQKVKSLVTTDEQRTRQFAYLLITGAFSSNSGSSGSGGSMADGVLTSLASSALSTGLNSLFGNVLGRKWQIGTNISSNDGTFSDMDMSVSVSRSFLDDKLTFNTNLGYRTDQTLSAANSFIGDFDVQYALTNSIKLKVFNQTNNQFYKQAPTTQGVGIVYTREAKRIKDLFKVFRKKRKNRVRESVSSEK